MELLALLILLTLLTQLTLRLTSLLDPKLIPLTDHNQQKNQQYQQRHCLNYQFYLLVHDHVFSISSAQEMLNGPYGLIEIIQVDLEITKLLPIYSEKEEDVGGPAGFNAKLVEEFLSF